MDNASSLMDEDKTDGVVMVSAMPLDALLAVFEKLDSFETLIDSIMAKPDRDPGCGPDWNMEASTTALFPFSNKDDL